MTTEPAPVCRLCGAAGASLVGTRRGTFSGLEFDFWRCGSCDYMFVVPFSGYAVYGAAYYEGRGADPYVDYESEYRDYRSTDRMDEFDDLWRVASGFIAANFPPGPVEWLDFGCGAGGMLKFLRDTGGLVRGGRRWTLDLAGHDTGTYADKLRSDDGFRIVTLGDLLAEPTARYDVISMIEVVEHIEYPDPVFALAARLLKPGGLLLLTTGNVASIAARRKGLDYGYLLPEIHVGYFTPRTLETVYRRHGLLPVRFRYGGTVRFKVVKTLRKARLKGAARLALRIPGVVRVIDRLFGTSQMPCARKAP